MRRDRLLVGAFAVLLVVASGIIGHALLVPDPLRLHDRLWSALLARHGREAVAAELAQRTHLDPSASSRLCLRYRARVGWSEVRQKRLAVLLHHEGLSSRLEGRLPGLVRQWRREHEAQHHRATRTEERVALLEAHARGLDRWLLRVHRRRIVGALEARRASSRRSVSAEARRRRRALPPPAPQDIRRLSQLWARHRLLMASAYELSLEIPRRDRTTGARMQVLIDALKRWVARHGRPPATLTELRLDAEADVDGFGERFEYEIDPETVRLLSPGFDGLRGTEDDQLHSFSWPE